MTTIAIGRIRPGKNPRTYFDPVEHAELTQSIRAVGVLQPLLVRSIDGSDDVELIAGERRLRAARDAGLTEIPILIRELSDDDAEAAALTENVQRAAMSPTEEAEAAQRILYRNHGDKGETARLLGWTTDKLDKRLALMSCAPEVRAALTDRKVSLGHAQLLAAVPAAKQVKALTRIIEGNISVARLKANIGKLAHRLADAIFDTSQCARCQYNSAQQIAEEVGLKKALKDTFAKIVNGKKDALIAALLNAPGFEYRGAVPKVMLYDRSKKSARTAIPRAIAAPSSDTRGTATHGEAREALATPPLIRRIPHSECRCHTTGDHDVSTVVRTG